MKKIRIFAGIMALLMLALCFASCANTPVDPETTTAGENASTEAPVAGSTEPAETTYPVDENGYELDRLPELNYNNEEFVIFTWSNQVMWEWNEDDTTNGEKNRNGTSQVLAGDAIISDVQYTAQNRQRSTCQVTLTGKKNMLTDIRLLVTADDHYVRTSDGNLMAAAHEEV